MTKGTTSYRIKNEEGLYYLTFATVEWIDVFVREEYSDSIVKNLNYCVANKGLVNLCLV